MGGVLLFWAGCGSQSSLTTSPVSPPVAADVPVGLTVTDTPPAGVTVLFFQVNITAASLSPGSASLLSSAVPIPINVSQLQTDLAFLGSANVPAGTYASLSVTLSNPQLTVYNGSGATIGSGGNACANGTVCQLTPSATPVTLTFSATPFPVTLLAKSPLAFMLDIHLDTVIQTDLSVNLGVTNGVTISQFPAAPAGQPIPGLGHVMGTVQSLTTDGFTLQTLDGRTFSIDVDSSTSYSYPDSVCPANDFSCVATQQIVKAEVSLQPDGTLLASEVDYVQAAGQTVVEGSIIRLSASGSNTLMDLILQEGPTQSNTLPMGRRVTVTVPASGVTYAIDSGSFTLPSGLSFASVNDLFVGQEVSVAVQGSITTASGPGNSSPWAGIAPTTFTTNSITLEPSQLTGVVSGWSPIGMSFTLGTIPNVFMTFFGTANALPTLAPVNLAVQTTAQTAYTNLTPDNTAGLAVNDVISVKGWLFRYFVIPQICVADWGCAPIGEIVAETVVGRPGPTPLF